MFSFSLSKNTNKHYSTLSFISKLLKSVSDKLMPIIIGTGDSTMVNNYSGTLYIIGLVQDIGLIILWKK